MTAQQLQKLTGSHPGRGDAAAAGEPGHDRRAGFAGRILAVRSSRPAAVREPGRRPCVRDGGPRRGGLPVQRPVSACLGEERLLFFPTGYKRSIQFGQEDPSGIVQRTAALNAVKNFDGRLRWRFAPTPRRWPRRWSGMQQPAREHSHDARVGDTSVDCDSIEEILADERFRAGRVRLRTGAVLGARRNRRHLFFFRSTSPTESTCSATRVDSIRPFDISTQLSTGKLACSRSRSCPNLKDIAIAGRHRVSFASVRRTGATYWIADGEYTLKRFNDIRTKILGDLGRSVARSTRMVTSRKGFLANSGKATFVLLNDNITRSAPPTSDDRLQYFAAAAVQQEFRTVGRRHHTKPRKRYTKLFS